MDERPDSTDGSDPAKRRRQRLLRDFFRNALSLALLKQTANASAPPPLHRRRDYDRDNGIPPYLLG